MVVFPQAKINLGLHVLFKREDGFHEIETCFYPVPLTDVLEAVPSDEFKFSQTGLEIPGKPDTNLCVRAFEQLRAEYNISPVHIHLHKIIPMGAGLGGGSSDGAWMLKLLNDLFSLGLDSEKLKHFAAQLGSDCPFFIDGTPAIGKGTGTTLSPAEIQLTGTFIRLIHPRIHVSTADAYGALTPVKNRVSVQELLLRSPATWKENLVNDFSAPIYARHPRIGQIENQLYEQGAFYACMSGSGSAVFGLFDHEPQPMESEDFVWTGQLS
jgi:4-diphosphocytidyl-2-C-methyl-D-erythritol kinase